MPVSVCCSGEEECNEEEGHPCINTAKTLNIELSKQLIRLWRSNLRSRTDAALKIHCIDDVDGGDGLALGVLVVRDGVAESGEENLQNTAGLLVDETRDSFDSTTANEMMDRQLLPRFHAESELPVRCT